MVKHSVLSRIVVPTAEDVHDGWATALAYADRIAGDPKFGVNEVVLFVAAKRQLTDTTFPDLVGVQAAKTLNNNGVVTLPSGKPMRAVTLATLRAARRGTLMLVFWADENMMEKVDGLDDIVAIVTYPWLDDGIDNWIRTWSPHIVGQADSAAAPLISDPIVAAALSSLTTCVNLGNHGLHGHYAEQTDRTLGILRAKNHPLDAEAMKLWAIKHGWHPKMAGDLEKKAKKVVDRKTKPGLRSFEGGAETYAYWQSKVQEAS